MGLRGSLRLRTNALRAEEAALEEKGGRKGWTVRVVDVEHGDEGKERTSDSSAKPKEYEILCEKLILASGLCSTPRPMQIQSQETFNKPIVNFSELGRKAQALLDDDNVQHVTVLGGSKAACDCVYMFASQGKKVSWIIRRTGHGPCWMSPPYVYVGPVKCWLKMLVTSPWMTWPSPCVWGDSDGFGWIRKALHNTRLGRWLVDGFWTSLSLGTLKQAGYLDDDVEGKPKGLWPLGNAFEYATQLGMLNYGEDLSEYVRRGQVEVVRKDVLGIGAGTVLCEDGVLVQTDAWVASSGWRFDPAVKLEPEVRLAGWGVPAREDGDVQRERWGMLNEKADREIWERFPRLRPEEGRKDGLLEEKEKLLETGAASGERRCVPGPRGGGEEETTRGFAVEVVEGDSTTVAGCERRAQFGDVGDDHDGPDNVEGGDYRVVGFCVSEWAAGVEGTGVEHGGGQGQGQDARCAAEGGRGRRGNQDGGGHLRCDAVDEVWAVEASLLES